MKKNLILFSFLVLLSTSSCVNPQESKGKILNSITRGSFTSHNGDLVEFYIASDGFRQYWGCRNSLVKWRPNEGVYLLSSNDGTLITALLVSSQQDQNSLTILLTELVNKNYSPNKAFKIIFDTYNLNEKDSTKKIDSEVEI